MLCPLSTPLFHMNLMSKHLNINNSLTLLIYYQFENVTSKRKFSIAVGEASIQCHKLLQDDNLTAMHNLTYNKKDS